MKSSILAILEEAPKQSLKNSKLKKTLEKSLPEEDADYEEKYEKAIKSLVKKGKVEIDDSNYVGLVGRAKKEEVVEVVEKKEKKESKKRKEKEPVDRAAVPHAPEAAGKYSSYWNMQYYALFHPIDYMNWM